MSEHCDLCAHASRGGAMGGGGKGEKAPLKISKKGIMKKMGYFHASKLLKFAFLSSLTRKYVLWKGFYHDFSTIKKASASGGLCPLTPTKGLCPLDSRQGVLPPGPPRFICPTPPRIYPGTAPACKGPMY